MYQYPEGLLRLFRRQIQSPLPHRHDDGGDDDVRGHGRAHDGGDDDVREHPLLYSHFQFQVMTEYLFLCEVHEQQIREQL